MEEDTSIEGTVRQIQQMNGCTRVTVDTKVDGEGQPIEGLSIIFPAYLEGDLVGKRIRYRSSPDYHFGGKFVAIHHVLEQMEPHRFYEEYMPLNSGILCLSGY